MNEQQKQVTPELISRIAYPYHHKQTNEPNNRGLDGLKQIEDGLKRVRCFRKGLSAVKGSKNSLQEKPWLITIV